MPVEPDRRTQVADRWPCLDLEVLTGRRNQSAQRPEGGIPPAGLVGGDHRLGRASRSSQGSLGEPTPATDGSKELGWLHLGIISDRLCRRHRTSVPSSGRTLREPRREGTEPPQLRGTAGKVEVWRVGGTLARRCHEVAAPGVSRRRDRHIGCRVAAPSEQRRARLGRPGPGGIRDAAETAAHHLDLGSVMEAAGGGGHRSDRLARRPSGNPRVASADVVGVLSTMVMVRCHQLDESPPGSGRGVT